MSVSPGKTWGSKCVQVSKWVLASIEPPYLVPYVLNSYAESSFTRIVATNHTHATWIAKQTCLASTFCSKKSLVSWFMVASRSDRVRCAWHCIKKGDDADAKWLLYFKYCKRIHHHRSNEYVLVSNSLGGVNGRSRAVMDWVLCHTWFIKVDVHDQFVLIG